MKKKKPNKKKSKQAKQGNENDPEGPPKKQLSVDAQKKKAGNRFDPVAHACKATPIAHTRPLQALQAIATSLSERATWSKRLTDSSSQVLLASSWRCMPKCFKMYILLKLDAATYCTCLHAVQFRAPCFSTTDVECVLRILGVCQ